jgi:hypothetical protein
MSKIAPIYDIAVIYYPSNCEIAMDPMAMAAALPPHSWPRAPVAPATSRMVSVDFMVVFGSCFVVGSDCSIM